MKKTKAKKETTKRVAKKRIRPLAGESKKPQDRRAYIRQHAATLFAEYGYSASTIDQLSEQTGLNKGTIYYYYESKADILFDVCIKSTAQKAVKLIEPSLKMEYAFDGLEHFIEVLVTWVSDYPKEVRVYFQEVRHLKRIFNEEQYKVAREQQVILTNTINKIIQKGVKSGEFESNNVKFSSRFVIGLIMWIYQWPEDKLDINDLTKQVSSFVMSGLKAKKIRKK